MTSPDERRMLDWIENAGREDLLRKWRFEPIGSAWFVGEVGKAFTKRMSKVREEDPAAWTAASKGVGWG